MTWHETQTGFYSHMENFLEKPKEAVAEKEGAKQGAAAKRPEGRWRKRRCAGGAVGLEQGSPPSSPGHPSGAETLPCADRGRAHTGTGTCARQAYSHLYQMFSRKCNPSIQVIKILACLGEKNVNSSMR